MIYSGTFVKVLESTSGKRSDGSVWSNIRFFVRDKEPNLFEAWGNEVEKVKQLNDGDKVSLEFNPSTREYQGKYYVSLKVWKVLTFQGEVKEDKPEPTKSFGQPTIPDDSGLPF